MSGYRTVNLDTDEIAFEHARPVSTEQSHTSELQIMHERVTRQYTILLVSMIPSIKFFPFFLS